MTTEAAAGLEADLTGHYTLDPVHTRLGFVARHAMVTKVRGRFQEFEGSDYLDAQNPSDSNVEVTIHAKSVDTGSGDRDNHLRSNDFFDMDQYPTITFKSTGIEAQGDGSYRVTGDLTIKGTTKPVTIDFDFTGAAIDPWGNQRVGFEGSTIINRKDWGVSWNAPLEAGGLLVSEKVTLEIDVSAVKQPE